MAQPIFVPLAALEIVIFLIMLFLKNLRKSIKTLISKNAILNVPIDGIFEMVGESNIKTFVQIGSNDGMKNDPIHQYIIKNAWEGILVEPDIANFKRLRKNYSCSNNLIFENTAIGPQKGEMLFYRIKEIRDDEPGWYDQVGSFDRATFLKNIKYGKGLDKRILTDRMQVITFNDLVQKHNFHNIDLLHTDTEGFDFKILRSIDFSKHAIKLILFEGKWMSSQELKEIIQYLKKFGYRIFRSGIDYAGLR